jgi:hypothetical protein
MNHRNCIIETALAEQTIHRTYTNGSKAYADPHISRFSAYCNGYNASATVFKTEGGFPLMIFAT